MRDIDRRRFLELTGAAGAAGLAGCTGLGGDGNGSPDDSGTPNEDGSGTPGNNPEQTDTGSGSAVLETPDSPFSFFASTDIVGFPTAYFENHEKKNVSAEDAYITYRSEDLEQFRNRAREIGREDLISHQEEFVAQGAMPGWGGIVSVGDVDFLANVNGEIGYDIFAGVETDGIAGDLKENDFEKTETYKGFETFEGGKLPVQREIWRDEEYSRIVGLAKGGVLQVFVPPKMSSEEGRGRYKSLVEFLEGEGQSLADEREDVQKMKDWYSGGYNTALYIDQEGANEDGPFFYPSDTMVENQLDADNVQTSGINVYGNGTTATHEDNISHDDWKD